MSEVDYQMALLLQHRFEQEHKSSSTKEKSDYELARLLQEQFEQEAATENPSNLVYDTPKKEHNSSKSLTDPSWELADPTPDIHGLFMAFNQRYFWNKLLAVCVSWSKRMTSCAGICSYNGRGGMCSITLSEPLLKLRPRKDLVETLLHEMIHAYLFVTHNNTDRDGHGPEFHKHMFRINKESGTNITVYHTFHDEVRLYKQHWWRCNGPCQTWKPYFGMVRRATNRAPGPYDRWFGEHSRNCGGSFIKVKEPKKKGKNVKDKKPDKPDIRKFFPESETRLPDPCSSSGNIKGFKDLPSNNVQGKFNSSSTKTLTKNNTTSSSNIKGFKDLPSSNVKGKSNSSSTITITNNNNTQSNSFTPSLINKEKTVITSDKLPDKNTTNEFVAVRNHWANKFPTSSKRPSPSPKDEEPQPKIAKPSTSATPDEAECPICLKKISMIDLNPHLDKCLNLDQKEATSVDLTQEEDTKECPLCNTNVNSSCFDIHVEACILKVYDGIGKELGLDDPKVPCLACGKNISKKDLNAHLDDCMNDFEMGDRGKTEDDDEEESKSQFNCPFCLKLVKVDEMKDHVDTCLKGDNGLMESLMDDFDD